MIKIKKKIKKFYFKKSLKIKQLSNEFSPFFFIISIKKKKQSINNYNKNCV